MFKRKIFKKRKTKKNFLYILFILIIFLSGIYIIFFKKLEYFIIDPNNNVFYVIPDDKEGTQIPNIQKKSLHLSHDFVEEILIINNPDINFSIQIETNEDYFFLKEKKTKLINSIGKLFNNGNLFVAKSSTNIGLEYFLLFGNFDNKLNAQIFCKKFISIDSKCIIVNVQKLD